MSPRPIRMTRKRNNDLRIPVKCLILIVIVALFIFFLYPSLVVQRYQYGLGDIAESDIKAPQDFFIEDQVATQANRQQAAETVLTVYDHDPRIEVQIKNSVVAAFGEMRKIIENFKDVKSAAGTSNTQPPDISHETGPQWHNRKGLFESLIATEIGKPAFDTLLENAFSEAVAQRINYIISEIQSNGVVANKEILLKEINKGIVLRNVASQTEQKVTALRRHYSPAQAKAIARILAEPMVKDTPKPIVKLIIHLSQKLVQPNLTLNRNETEKRKKEAINAVKPILYRFKAGEMLVREGERITAEQLRILDTLSNQKDHSPIAAKGFGAGVFVAAFIFTIYVLYLREPQHAAAGSQKNLLFLSAVLIMVFVIAKASVFFSAVASSVVPFSISSESIVYAAPAAAGAMLVCIFLGFEIALPFSLAASLCVALLLGNRLEIWVYFMISSAMGAYWVRRCRERKTYITAGLKLGVLNMLMASAVSIYAADNTGFKLPVDWAMAFSNGIASAIVAVGIAPLFEMSFGYTTDITLLELANLDRPILRRLMLEAPGTYHHSVIVGSLVEAAAADIGANPLLAKVCGYYHDIGKVRKPLYFIENQTNMKNKHDKLAPSMSSLILIAHIKDGIEIAKKEKLGQAIIDTIEQHHGNSLISYFFNKAKQLKGAETVKEDDFRYPGPRPQT